VGTLLYSPGVKVYISTEKNGTIEVSDDLVDGTMVRRSDGVSSFNFTLQNARRKYDGVFAPNDRIVVMMRRITWMRVFTGYLNSVPLLTAWPRVVPLTASCSLKRIQYWYWDSGLPATQTMIAKALEVAREDDNGDGGIANAILTILKEVMGWPPEKVHIAGIPKDWFQFAYKIAQDIDARAEEADEIAQQFYSALQGGGVIGGGGIPTGGDTIWSGTMKPGNYGGEEITKEMCPYIEKIYNNGKHLGASNRDLVIGMMTAMQESSMGSDHSAMTVANRYGCIGLFQQTIGSWGTKAQLLDADYQCKKFFGALLKVKNRDSMSLAQAAEKVQVSGEGWRYAKHENMGRAVVTYLNNASKNKTGGSGSSGGSQGSDPNWQGGSGSWGTGKATGAALINTAMKLVNNYKIPYREGGDSSPSTPANKVTYLDCSSFVQWVVYQTLGSLYGLPRVTWDQISYLKAHGKKISAAQGAKTAGAIMFTGSGGHVEMSVGDGRHTVGAHHSGTNASAKDFGSVGGLAGYFTQAYLMPNVQYSVGSGGTYDPGSGGGDGGTGGDAGAAPQIPIEKAQDQPWYNPNDPYDKLFGNNPWTPVVNSQEAAYASTFTGIRALLNDQPLLPYLKNLFNATMRSFCSAPNGDLIGWFPDYYGIWGTAAKMVIEPIEIRDFNVEWSDDFFVTHQYTVAAAATSQIDLASGMTTPADVLPAAMTLGIATIDVPSILYALFGIDSSKDNAEKFINYVYKRFGARPDFQQLPGVVGTKGEFFSALFLFMRQWAYQYNADIPLTFMPELWPGMLIQIPAFDFQAYVTTVTHSFSFGENGGFSTSVNIAAPARLPKSTSDRSNALIGLPIAGGLDPSPPKKGK
jgi:hypothetical protein